VSKTSWEDIERLTKFCKAFRERRPNSPIVKSVRSIIEVEGGDGPPTLYIEDLEMLVEVAKDQLPLRDKMRLWSGPAWVYDKATMTVIEQRDTRIEAAL
jgi:hypothetical protein